MAAGWTERKLFRALVPGLVQVPWPILASAAARDAVPSTRPSKSSSLRSQGAARHHHSGGQQTLHGIRQRPRPTRSRSTSLFRTSRAVSATKDTVRSGTKWSTPRARADVRSNYTSKPIYVFGHDCLQTWLAGGGQGPNRRRSLGMRQLPGWAHGPIGLGRLHEAPCNTALAWSAAGCVNGSSGRERPAWTTSSI